MVIDEVEVAEADAGAETARLLAALQTPADAPDACDLCREDGARASQGSTSFNPEPKALILQDARHDCSNAMQSPGAMASVQTCVRMPRPSNALCIGRN